MRKVLVIGSPGAGKSTFARKLRDATGLPLYYLDMLWHRPDQTNISTDEFDMRLREIISEDRWILDGNYSRTLEVRLKACDTVFLLDYPLEICLSGIESRVGKEREDLPWIERELDGEFRRQVIAFPTGELPQIYGCLEKHRRGKTTIVFRSREEADSYLDTLAD